MFPELSASDDFGGKYFQRQEKNYLLEPLTVNSSLVEKGISNQTLLIIKVLG